MHRDHSRPHPKLTADLDHGETPEIMYAAWRYADRLFSAPPHKQRGPEIAALDVHQLSPRMQYVMWHLIVSQRRGDRDRIEALLAEYPNLRPLEQQQHVQLQEPIWLSRNPMHPWKYYRIKNIYL